MRTLLAAWLIRRFVDRRPYLLIAALTALTLLAAMAMMTRYNLAISSPIFGLHLSPAAAPDGHSVRPTGHQ